MMKRRWYSCWRVWLGYFGLLAGMQILTACLGPLGSSIGATSTETPINRIERGLLDATDLPFGWRRESTGVPQDLTGSVIARYRDYRGPESTPIFVRIGQSTALYQSEEDSRQAYEVLKVEIIPAEYRDEWPEPEELRNVLQADESIIGCSEGRIDNIPHRLCGVVARYGSLVTVVRTLVFEDRWLTMAQFRHLLERVDAKMEAIREPQGEATPTPAP